MELLMRKVEVEVGVTRAAKGAVHSRTSHERKEVGAVRRATLLFAGAAIWLFLFAIPVFADNGPHVKGQNSTALMGSCASCHRAHSAQAPDLVKSAMPNLCYSCHGSGNAGATTDVQDGVAFATTATVHGTGSQTGTGALRGGGFDYALINTVTPTSLTGTVDKTTGSAAIVGTGTSFLSQLAVGSYVTIPGGGGIETFKVNAIADDTHFTAGSNALYTATGQTATMAVPGNSNATIGVLGAGVGTTSAHSVGGTAVSMWGSGPLGTAATFTVTTNLTCASCHDPHGNGQYRILKATPDDSPSAPGVYINDATTKAYITTNYGTIGTANQNESAKNVAANSGANGPNSGSSVVSVADSSSLEYVPAGTTSTGTSPAYFKGMYSEASTRWCATCHTRYFAGTGSAGNKTWTEAGSIDATYKFRHATRNILDPNTAFGVTGSHTATDVYTLLGAGTQLWSQIKYNGYIELDRTSGLPTGWVATSAPYIGDLAGSGTTPKYEGIALVDETYNLPSGTAGVDYTPPNPIPTNGTVKTVSGVGGSTGAADLMAGSAPRCITCHVSHGSNAGVGSMLAASGATSLVTGTTFDSALLRLDGRGVCQNCHKK